MTRQAKTKATPTTMPSNFQNKCCSSKAERQLLNSFLLDELHVIFSTYPVEPHSGVVLIWKLEHGVHSSVTTNSSTNQHGEVEVLTDSFSSRTGASASLQVGKGGKSKGELAENSAYPLWTSVDEVSRFLRA